MQDQEKWYSIIRNIKMFIPFIISGLNTLLAIAYCIPAFNKMIFPKTNVTILVILVIIMILPRSFIDLDPSYSKWFCGGNVFNAITLVFLLPMYIWMHIACLVYILWLGYRTYEDYANDYDG